MRINRAYTTALALGAALAIYSAPAEAQGRSKNQDRDRVERSSNEQGRQRTNARGNGAGKVPPGWCQGQGNPHNTVENCGYRNDGRYDNGRYEDGRYEDGRYEDGRYDPDYSRSGSYEREHDSFHQYLDRKYSDLASQRRLDVTYQIQLRVEKAAEHDRWHQQAGISH
jgi:hypothetical protein